MRDIAVLTCCAGGGSGFACLLACLRVLRRGGEFAVE